MARTHEPTVPPHSDDMNDAVLRGFADVDERVDLWHAGGCPADWSLADALGMTAAEYAAWIRDGQAITGRPLPEAPAT